MSTYQGGRVPPPVGPRLLIRSFVGDVGVRPFNAIWWESPDIELIDAATGLTANEKELIQNHNYQIKVTMTNIGTLPAFGTILELYIKDPHCTTTKTQTGADLQELSTQIIGEPIPCGVSKTIYSNKMWTPSAEYVQAGKGHACIIARAYVPIYGIPNHFDCKLNTGIAHQNVDYIWVEPGTTSFIPFQAFSGKNRDSAEFRMEIIESSKTRALSEGGRQEKFSLIRAGIINTENNGKIDSIKQIKEAYDLYHRQNKLPPEYLKNYQKLIPQKKISAAFDNSSGKKYLCAVVEVPASNPPGNEFSFRIEKWRGSDLVGGLTYVLKVKSEKIRKPITR
jgi:hypothetical protein